MLGIYPGTVKARSSWSGPCHRLAPTGSGRRQVETLVGLGRKLLDDGRLELTLAVEADDCPQFGVEVLPIWVLALLS